MIAIALTAFTKYGVTNRVKLVEGPAADTLKTLRIAVTKPVDHGEVYFNRKGYYSLNIQGIFHLL